MRREREVASEDDRADISALVQDLEDAIEVCIEMYAYIHTYIHTYIHRQRRSVLCSLKASTPRPCRALSSSANISMTKSAPSTQVCVMLIAHRLVLVSGGRVCVYAYTGVVLQRTHSFINTMQHSSCVLYSGELTGVPSPASINGVAK